MGTGLDPFLADALPTNQSGELTDAQRHNLGNEERSRKRGARNWALFPLAIAAIILFAPGIHAGPLAHYGVPFVCLILAVGLVLWSLSGSDRLAQDLRTGRVESLEGAIGKRRVSEASGGQGSTLHFLDVGGQSFSVGRSIYDAAPDAGYVRIYYLPRSKHFVNLERLEGEQVADPGSPQDVLRTLKSSLMSRDRARRNEARAEMQTMVDRMNAHVSQQPVPPPGAVQDARGLAGALVGIWRSPMATFTFHPDGTVEGAFVGGQTRSGRWSIDADGRLHTDVMGQDGAADAWIEGGQLTISLNGTGLTFDRVAG